MSPMSRLPFALVVTASVSSNFSEVGKSRFTCHGPFALTVTDALVEVPTFAGPGCRILRSKRSASSSEVPPAAAEAPVGAQRRVLVSLMVRLHCQTTMERLLIPAFVFFFQKLYPFRASNNPRKSIAAAAGGCMLVRRSALKAAGGLAPIKSALIDDCALAASEDDFQFLLFFCISCK